MVAVGIVTGIGTLFLYSVASKVFSMVMYTIGLYLEPVFGALIVFIFGIEDLPCNIFVFSVKAFSFVCDDNWSGTSLTWADFNCNW